ncbi:MAG TPA: hypothetical protein PLP34_07855 [Chitinophagaceae bacterium]|nr:hypothetical protein [Chitinophagaceae bacterium]HNF72311.1 hypothetical protein [Chitinophagaceae bacterium]
MPYFLFVFSILNLLSPSVKAQLPFCYAISGRGQAITPWTDIRRINPEDGSSDTWYAEQSRLYELNSLDRNLDNAILDNLTPMGQGVASCAYDPVRHRLYYSTMEFSDLRYFNLDSANPVFTIVQLALIPGAAFMKPETQFSRMCIGADGNGYMLNNTSTDFFRFSTGKKPKIESLGSILNTSDPRDTTSSLFKNQGGDMIALTDSNFLLFSAMQNVFYLSPDKRQMHCMGKIKGLPPNFTINGAAVINDSTILLGSALNLNGLYAWNIVQGKVHPFFPDRTGFTVSDLDNGNLLPVYLLQQLENQLQKPDIIEAVVNQVAVSGVKPVQAQAENSPGFYFIRQSLSDFQLVFYPDEPGPFLITFSNTTGQILHEEKQTVNQSEYNFLIHLSKPLSSGSYYIKAKHLPSGHTYLRKMDIE